MKKKQPPAGSIVNRRARHDYTILETFVVGMVLTGRETKALRMGRGQLTGTYVMVKDEELWLLNAQISSSKAIMIPESEVMRTRKLLAKKREIAQLIDAKQKGLALIPLEIKTRSRYIKLVIATAKGKKEYDKRETLKKRDVTRDISQELKYNS